jgi:hypothetical protein
MRTEAQKEASRENGKKGGRPREKAKEKLVVLEVRFTKAEREKVVAMGGSRLIKKLLLAHGADVLAEQKAKPQHSIKHYDKIDPALLLELSKIGNNLNQLSRWCNTYKQGAEAVTVGYWLAKIEEDIKAILPKVVYAEGSDAH